MKRLFLCLGVVTASLLALVVISTSVDIISATIDRRNSAPLDDSKLADAASLKLKNPRVAQQTIYKPITTDGIFLELNEVRREHDLPQFTRNLLLEKSTTAKCADMVENDYYGHGNPTTGKRGYSYMIDYNVYYLDASENLNRGVFLDSAAVVDSWMSSESHRASILDSGFTEIGVSTCKESDSAIDLVVQHKIKPAPQNTNYTAPSQPRRTTCTHYEKIGYVNAKTVCN